MAEANESSASSSGWTLNNLIKAGMEFFTGKTVLKTTLEAKETELAEANKLVETRNAELKTAQTERDTARTELATAKSDLAAKASELTTANAKIAELEKTSKTVSQKATEITAAQGIPPAQLPVTGAGSTESPDALAGAIKAETDPVKRAALFAKWKAATN